jgi:hypothetical protein
LRQKILMLVVAAMLMVAAAAPPALASHGYWWSGWEPWAEGSPWWCSWGWYHDENEEWTFELIVCWNEENGEIWYS